MILGHRGAPREAPENTIASFQEAVRQGAHGVELDVQRTEDGVPVVIHDDSLERTSSGTGRVNSWRWSDLKGVSVGGHPLPSFAQAVSWARSAGALLNVEIKATDVEEATLEILAAADMLDRTIISSFNSATVRRVAERAPDVRCYLLCEHWTEETLDLVNASGAGGLCLGVDAATADALDTLWNADLPTIVWTVDSAERIRELLRANIAGIITNYPARAVRIAREMVEPE